MQYSYDRTGFPLIRLPRVGVEVHLLPVTKIQFEMFLAEPNAFGDDWYSEVLKINPRCSYRDVAEDQREQLFISGIFAEEVLDFARWLGPRFDLPTVDLWRKIYKELREANPALEPINTNDAPRAAHIIQQLSTQLNTNRLFDLSLMTGGFAEWAQGGRQNPWVGLGSPRPEFYQNCWNPLQDDSLFKPIKRQIGVRLPYLGCRLYRRIA